MSPIDDGVLEPLVDFEVDDADTLLARAADTDDLRAALSQLPTDERMVLALHDGEGWTGRRIGEMCGLPTATIHKRLQRGRVRLLRELAGSRGRAQRPSAQCRQVRAGASDYVDGVLDEAALRVVEDHVRTCRRCASLVQALVGLRAALARGPGLGGPPEEITPRVALALIPLDECARPGRSESPDRS